MKKSLQTWLVGVLLGLACTWPLAAETKLSKEEIVELIERHGPIVYLDSEEKYKLDSPVYYLNHSNLVNSNGVKRRTSVSTFQSDYNAIKVGVTGLLKDNIWLEPTGEVPKGGNMGRAEATVHIKEVVSGFTDIQFWFFYPYNGPGTARVQLGEVYDKTALLKPFGEHTGDWEHVTLRFKNQTKALEAVYFSQHDSGEAKKASQVQMEGGHVVVYSSKNGHASYPSMGDNQHRVLHKCAANVPIIGCTGHLDVDLKNYTNKGARFNAYESGKYSIVESNSPSWVGLAYRWGPKKETKPSHSQVRSILEGYFGPIGGTFVSDIGIAIYRAVVSGEDQSGPTNISTKTDWHQDEILFRNTWSDWIWN